MGWLFFCYFDCLLSFFVFPSIWWAYFFSLLESASGMFRVRLASKSKDDYAMLHIVVLRGCLLGGVNPDE